MRGCWVLVFLATLSGAGFAQERVAITSLEEVDEDFAFQGEYAGLILPEDSAALRRLGLQVVARGGGRFEAVVWSGGLPGDRASARQEKLKGQREGDTLALRGDEMTATIHQGRVTMTSVRGNPLGSFLQVRRTSPTLGLCPPPNAIVLFDGRDTGELKKPRITADGLLQEGTETVRSFKDYRLHVEFRLPYMPNSKGQQRGNSGVYLQSRYEVQVLDSFGLEGAHNECGALYRFRKPDINMCFPPLAWQTYDITFYSARFDAEGNKIGNARVCVVHNGVTIHNNVELKQQTGAGRKETPELFPIKFQNHRDPVRFRNLWLVDLSAPCCSGTVADNRPGASGVVANR